MTDVSLSLQAEAVVRHGSGIEENIPLGEPVGLTVLGIGGGAIDFGGAVCDSLEVPPGPFTYRVGSEAGMTLIGYDPDGSSVLLGSHRIPERQRR